MSALAPFVPTLLRSARDGGSWQADGSFVFADISGFTRLSEQLADLGKAGAEELTTILNGTFEALLNVARAEGGDLIKYGGDALFLFFRGDDHATRACRAAHGMRATLKARGAVVTGRGRVVLRISMGVHSGPFSFVLAGTSQRELLVVGEHATEVTAMESAADAGEILVSAATAALLPPAWVGAPKEGGRLLHRVTGVAASEVVEPDLDDDVLTPFVPHAIRRRVLGGDHSAEHRRVTIAFVHVGGLDTLLLEQGLPEVSRRLGAFVDLAHEAAERHEVCIIASDVAGGGAKLILTAGAPDAVEDGEGRMLAVGRELLDGDVGLPVRVGVNSGHVFAGEVGAPWRRVYTVMGDAVNLAARLMAKAAPGELVASHVSVERSATPFETTPLEPFFVKGKRLPQIAFSIGRRIEGRARVDVEDAAFVGREQELARLIRAYERAMAGAGSAVAVIGEAGLGKSRLVHELAQSVAGVRVVRLTCEPFAAERPYFVARLLLRTAMGIGLDLDPVAAGEELTQWLTTRAPAWSEYAPLLAAAIDAECAETKTVADLDAAYRPVVLREAATAVLAAAFDHPLVLVVEDAMWMDEASELVLARALEDIPRRSWLACLTARDASAGLVARLGASVERVELAPLDDSVSEQLVAMLTEEAAIPEHELRQLCERAAGNPLYLLELAHARRALGSLDAIPATLEDLISARIDRLMPADRMLLRHAAVLGDRFSPALFRRTLGDVLDGPPNWQRLNDFLLADQRDVHFKHELVRRVAYEGLPFTRRRELHGRVARALVPAHGDPDDARLELLALHSDRSGDHAMAWTFNRMAGHRAWDNYATVEATAFFDRAVDNARADGHVPPEELARAAEALVDVSLLTGRYDLARDGLRIARKLRHDPVDQARLCRKEATLRERLERHDAGLRWCRRGLDAIAPLDDEREALAERGRLAATYAGMLIRQRRFALADRWCRRALDAALATGDRATEARACYLLEWARRELGDPDAPAYSLRAQAIYEELHDYARLARVLNNRAIAAFSTGAWDECCATWEEGRDALRRAGDIMEMARLLHNLAEIRTEQGRLDEAERHAREARRIYRSGGEPDGVAVVTGVLGRARARAGHPDEGAALLREARDQFVGLGNVYDAAESTARLAEALVFAGRYDEAADELDELGERAADGGPACVSLALRMGAAVAESRGDEHGAVRLLSQARAAATDGGARWEDALASLQLARLAVTGPAERAELEAVAGKVLTSFGIDVERVLPPAPHARTEPVPG